LFVLLFNYAIMLELLIVILSSSSFLLLISCGILFTSSQSCSVVYVGLCINSHSFFEREVSHGQIDLIQQGIGSISPVIGFLRV